MQCWLDGNEYELSFEVWSLVELDGWLLGAGATGHTGSGLGSFGIFAHGHFGALVAALVVDGTVPGLWPTDSFVSEKGMENSFIYYEKDFCLNRRTIYLFISVSTSSTLKTQSLKKTYILEFTSYAYNIYFFKFKTLNLKVLWTHVPIP